MLEPDGSRTLGVVPPFRGNPEPPQWLRSVSHLMARVACKHYVYEAYSDRNGHWLVRYQGLPDRGEALDATEQAFLFSSDGSEQPQPLKRTDIQFQPKGAELSGMTFVLVDRRDLIRP